MLQSTVHWLTICVASVVVMELYLLSWILFTSVVNVRVSQLSLVPDSEKILGTVPSLQKVCVGRGVRILWHSTHTLMMRCAVGDFTFWLDFRWATATSLLTFRHKLKTFLFRRSYDNVDSWLLFYRFFLNFLFYFIYLFLFFWFLFFSSCFNLVYCNVVLQCFCTYTTLISSLSWWWWWWWWWANSLSESSV